MHTDRRQDWMTWKLQGWSYGRIAKEAGVTRQRVQQVLAPPKAIKAIVAKRAEYRCQLCQMELGTSGHVHHANHGAETADDYEDIDHLQYLCMPCHRNVHGNPGGNAKSHVILQLRVTAAVYNTIAREVQHRQARGLKASLNSVAIEWMSAHHKNT